MLVILGQAFCKVVETLTAVAHFIQHTRRRCQLGIVDLLLLRPQSGTIGLTVCAAIEQFADRLHLLQKFIGPVRQRTR